MDCSLPGSPVPGILQARVLQWVAISFSIFCIILLKKKKNHSDFPGGPVVKGKWFRSLVQEDSICQSN